MDIILRVLSSKKKIKIERVYYIWRVELVYIACRWHFLFYILFCSKKLNWYITGTAFNLTKEMCSFCFTFFFFFILIAAVFLSNEKTRKNKLNNYNALRINGLVVIFSFVWIHVAYGSLLIQITKSKRTKKLNRFS